MPNGIHLAASILLLFPSEIRGSIDHSPNPHKGSIFKNIVEHSRCSKKIATPLFPLNGYQENTSREQIIGTLTSWIHEKRTLRLYDHPGTTLLPAATR
jgi:hypothetical protein